MTPGTSLPSVNTEVFSGPVELLVDEVRRQRVAIEDLDLAPLTERFLCYLAETRARDMVLEIEWCDMAATLIRWKSRSLLPADPEDRAAGKTRPDPEREEVARLLREHKEQAARKLGEWKREAEARLHRRPDPLWQPAGHPEADDPDTPEWTSVAALIDQARALGRWAAEYRVTWRHWRETAAVRDLDPVTVEEMVQTVRRELAQASAPVPFPALALLDRQPTAAHGGALFLGLLEMVRGQEISVDQKEAWGEIWIIVANGQTR